ncbi:hypothetical protein CRYUN_Cryun31cG0124800 [Craigia yunnanensis]
MSVMKRLKQMNWREECGKIISNLKGLRKDKRLQSNKLHKSKSPSRPLIRLRGRKSLELKIRFLSIY